MSIQPLPEQVIAQIKSSIAITNLNGVIFELVKNSLDAGSTKVDINVDYSRGACIVEDDGLGIPPPEFEENGGLGKLYHSSKLNSQNAVHGGRGRFLASLGAMALLAITSHHNQHRSHNTLTVHNSEVVSRQCPAPAQQHLSNLDHGTRVTVRNLFGNMPVRVKQRAVFSETQGASIKEWETLKSIAVSLCLAWPHMIAVTVRELATNQRIFFRDTSKSALKTESSRVCSILSQSATIAPNEKGSWISVGASTASLVLSGAISLDPRPTKYAQFISFGIRPILASEGQAIFHDEVNRCFQNSAFGTVEEGGELCGLEGDRRAEDARLKGNGYTNRELKQGKKGVDRWPMFYLNIEQLNSQTGAKAFDVDEIFEDKSSSLSAIIELMQAMVFEFLTKNHFRPRPSRGQRLGASETQSRTPSVGTGKAPTQRMEKIYEGSSSPKARLARLSGTKERKLTKAQVSSLDLLGTNVKLPSFRQSPSSDSPFDAWSRIKCGAPKPAVHGGNGLSAPSKIQRPSTTPPFKLNPVAPSKSRLSSLPLIASTGKVTRRPFEDVLSKPSESIPGLSKSREISPSQPRVSRFLSAPLDLTKNDVDDIVTWMNPVTKVESLVNKRTGHTVSTATFQSRFDQSRLSPSPNISNQWGMSAVPLQTPSNPDTWLESVLKKWENPIFVPAELSVPRISLDGETEYVLHGHGHDCSQLDIERTFTEASSGMQGRVSKRALRNAEVVGQVDKKFVLLKIGSSEKNTLMGEKMLVIIDQHAADERIRVESLLAELCTPQVPSLDTMFCALGVLTTKLDREIIYEVSEKDFELFKRKKHHFADWGICYDLSLTSHDPNMRGAKRGSKQKLIVHSLPPGILERCKSDPKVLLALIRAEVYSNSILSCSTSGSPSLTSKPDGKSWLTRIHHCPQGILNMINSRACRSAIMFNDELSKEQCEVLVRRLVDTAFPFQCAHGRPSLLPLVGLGALGNNLQEQRKGEERFGIAFNKWKGSTRSV